MLIDTPQIVENSAIVNATVPSGPEFPENPSIGELFYRTGLFIPGGGGDAGGGISIGGERGLYVFNGDGWETAAPPSETEPGSDDHATQVPHLSTSQKEFLDGLLVAFGDVNTLAGLEVFLGGTTLQTYLSSIESSKLNVNGSSTMTGNLNLGGFKLVNAAAPTEPEDLVTKAYVDSISQGGAQEDWVKAIVSASLI